MNWLGCLRIFVVGQWLSLFKLDFRIIAKIIAQSDLPPPRDAAEDGTAIGTMTSSLLEPFARLVGKWRRQGARVTELAGRLTGLGVITRNHCG
jgi:hypothetical protein